MAMAVRDSMVKEAVLKEDTKEKCTPCAENRLKAFALFYCKECLQVYCIACAKQHKNLMEDHVLIPRSDSHKWGKVRKASSFIQEEDNTLSQSTDSSNGVQKEKEPKNCVLL